MPKKFKPCKLVRTAKIVKAPGFSQTKTEMTGAKGKGIRYEAQVIDEVESRMSEDWVGLPGPWFYFIDQLNRERYAQPDWLGICPKKGRICIMEVKLTRTYRAWWQLNMLYKPLVEYVFPGWDIALLEVASVVKHFGLPEDVKMVLDLEQAPVDRTSFMKVNYG